MLFVFDVVAVKNPRTLEVAKLDEHFDFAVGPEQDGVLLRQAVNQELVKVLSAPDVKDELLKHGLVAQPGSRDELARIIDAESKVWGKLIRERKINAD